MFDVIGSSVIGLLLEVFGRSPVTVEPMQLLSWHERKIFTLPNTNPDPVAEKIVQDYLQTLAKKGINPARQGIWIQSDWIDLVAHNGTTPKSAASLTKIATTLAALSIWGANYQFETKIYATGEIKEGILQGDLWIEGNRDPFFVWEEAIAVGNTLQQLGIRQVRGKLIVNDKFYMNYKSEPLTAGKFLHKSFNEKVWSSEITRQYLTLPLGTPRPQIQIFGGVEVNNNLPSSAQLLVRHQSLSLAEILKQMNLYSNNYIAQMLADAVGGAQNVARIARKSSSVPLEEITLINGSGLEEANRISPRTVCLMLIAIEQLLKSHTLSVADLFPVAGQDLAGTMKNRFIPPGTAVKTGTLARVSALAGVIPTRDRDRIWFAIINGGHQTEYLRQQQDRLLQRLTQHWQVNSLNLTPSSSPYLGDPARNQKL